MTDQSSVLIIGAGTFGLSTAYHLSLAGYSRITVLERGQVIPPPLSAANDLNKIIRAEYEDPFYSDLALEAIAEWISNPIFSPHYHQTGYLLTNSANAPEKSKRSLAKSLKSIKTHPAWAGKLHDVQTRDDIRAVAPALTGPMTGWVGYFNELAGYAHSANALKALYGAVLKMGVRVVLGEEVSRLLYDGTRCVGAVTTSGKRFAAAKTVLTLGASVATVLPAVAPQITGTGFPVAHVQLSAEEAAWLKGIPVTYARDLGFFFEPSPGSGLLKLCPTSGGGYTNYSGEISAPPDVNDYISTSDESRVRDLLRETLPHLAGRPLIDKHICWVADTVDSNYIIDVVPGSDGLVIATGDSGHGFKMMPTVGKWIRDVMEKGRQDIPQWRWKQGSDKDADISWRLGKSTDLRDIVITPRPRL